MPVREVNRALGLSLPTDGPKTLNGLIVEHLQDIPEADVSIKIGSVPMEIVHAQGRTIKTVRIFRPAAGCRKYRGLRGLERKLQPLQTSFPRASSRGYRGSSESGKGSQYGNGSRGRKRAERTHVQLGRQGQGRQDHSRRIARGQRSRGQRHAAPPGHPGQKVKPVKRKGGGIRRLEGHRAVHAPARDHDEGRRAAAAVVRDRRQGRLQPRGGQAAASTSRPTSRPARRSPPRSASTRCTSTPCTATWCRPASRRVFWRRCSTASPPTRKKRSPSSRRSRRRCSTRSRSSRWRSSSPR